MFEMWYQFSASITILLASEDHELLRIIELEEKLWEKLLRYKKLLICCNTLDGYNFGNRMEGNIKCLDLLWNILCLHHSALWAKSCRILCDPRDCSLPGLSVHRIFQARILGWVAISSSRRSSQLRDRTRVFWISSTGRQILYHWATWEAVLSLINSHKFSILSLTKVSHPQGLNDSKVFRKWRFYSYGGLIS